MVAAVDQKQVQSQVVVVAAVDQKQVQVQVVVVAAAAAAVVVPLKEN
jgi:hypothetical protein